MRKRNILMIVGIIILSLTQICEGGIKEMETAEGVKDNTSDKLIVLWTSGDRDVALKMVFMYTYNAKKLKWWEDITFIVWGPSSKLLSEDKEVQAYMGKMIEEGVVVKACKACADQYGVSDKMESLGIEVKYMGEELTTYIKNRNHVVTF